MAQPTRKIYGSPQSSALRCFWALEEIGLEYEAMRLDVARKEHRADAFLKLNPMGKVPCLVDGDFAIWESMAINSYLCEKYGARLLGRSPEENGLIAQWSFWTISELQKPLMDMLVQMHFVPQAKRDRVLCERSQKASFPLLAILDRALGDRRYLVGDRFTLADLNAASACALNDLCGNDLSKLPQLQTWLRACTERPAFQKLVAATAAAAASAAAA